MGKKHRRASTRPRLGKAPRTGAQIANAAPKKRKALSTKKAAAAKAARTPRRSPEFERSVVMRNDRDDSSRHEKQIPFGNDNKKSKDKSDDNVPAEAVGYRGSGLGAHGVIPLVAICGRPNVGKSTLFNRVTGSRRSIVGDEPGITRDRIYGEVEWAGRTARLVDTGGVIPDDEAVIPAEIFRQARVALDEADAIVMVVDGRTEIAAPDMELARLLLRNERAKPLFLAVNKMDSAELEAGAENFRTLGFRNVVPVSAEHGIGVADLLDEVWAALPAETVAEEPTENMEGLEEEAEEDEGDAIADADAKSAPFERRLRTHGEHVQRETKVAIIGRPNVGKSTLLNALTGTERAIVSPIAGTTRDAVDEVVERDGHAFRFIDTAGIRRKGKTKLMAEKLSVVMSRKHLEAADVALLMIDATEGVTGSDATIGGYAHESGRSVIIVVNKWDLMTEVGLDGKRLFDGKAPADKKVYEEQVRDALKYLDYAPLLFVSAAESKGVDEVFKKVELVARERRKRVSTGAMNRFLDKIDFQRASVPMNRRVKIYYMTQAAVAPPTFVLFTDRDVQLHFSYERFLANEIRRAFRFIGSPIWFKVRARNKKKAE
ncbi:MAG TPA: ribosome biogenesis GTPase Der [Acidobacteriaceae bacterium]|nr:ribosome biogenesis GTPase Der [Acidobacteriaceae bacterium]